MEWKKWKKNITIEVKSKKNGNWNQSLKKSPINVVNLKKTETWVISNRD